MNQVLALKYRPRKFQDLVGQDTISATLSLALDSKRLSHAYLFSGLRGSGKTSTARIMAKALVCQEGPTSNPCDVCANCMSANEYKHLDIIEMDAASNRGIDDIKDLIEHTKYKPSSARYKVFIIDEVHMLTTQAFNALLKTLEEPPEFVKFILATTDPLKLPATILSRTQHFRFKRIPNKDVIHHLIHILNLENISFEEDALEILTRSGQGSLRDTLTLLDQAIIFSKGTINTSAVTDMMGMIDPAFMSKLFDTILEHGDTNKFLDDLESYDAGQVIDEMTIFLKFKMLARDPKFDTYMFDRFFRILGDAKQLLAINSDSGFVLILTMSKMIEATNIKTIDEIISDIQQVPQKEVTQNIETKTKVQSKPLVQENKMEEAKVEDVSAQIQAPIEEAAQPAVQNADLYAKVIFNIYERSHDLGECFENSFKLNKFENNQLVIDSYAHGECGKALRKNWQLIKSFIEDIYGQDIDIEFNKIEIKESPRQDIVKPLEETVQSASMIEDVINEDNHSGSGCVANMGAMVHPSQAQQEITMNHIINSPMVQKMIELFQPETQFRIKNKS